jgi:cell division protein FtsN
MKNSKLRFLLSFICIYSILMAVAASVSAAPVQFNQVVQVVNVRPGKANTGGFSQLRLVNDDPQTVKGDDEKPAAPQDDRVITETRVEIVEDDVCDCVEEQVVRRGFPKWALLGLGAVPLLFLFRNKDRTPTQTPTPPGTETPTPTTTPPGETPTPTPPGETPTPTPPTETPTPTPPITTPTPPEPVPEPMTILLFGTGLAGVGVAARKKFGKKEKKEVEE